MRRFLKGLLAFAVLWGSAEGGEGPGSRLFFPATQAFTEREGLPHLTVNQIVPDPQGRLWAATQDGIAVFSGQAWTPLPLPRECRSTYIRSLLPAQDGALWVGTQDDGLWEYRRGVWNHHSPETGFSSTRVNTLFEAQEGDGVRTIYAGTGGSGLLRFQGARWETVRGLPHGWVWRIRPDVESPDRLWITTSRGVVSLNLRRPGEAEGLLPGTKDMEVNDFTQLRSPDGRLETYVGVWGWGVAKCAEGRLDFGAGATAFPSKNPTCLVAGPGPEGVDTLWAGSYNLGFFWRNREGVWHGANYLRGTHSKGVYWILPRPGRRPALWIGFYGAGVLSVDLEGWHNLDLPFPETGLAAYAFANTQEGGRDHYWLATSLGLAEWTGETWRVHSTRNGLLDDRVECLHETRALGGRTLLASTLQGLMAWQNGRWKPLPPPGPSWRSAIKMLETEVDGRPALWIGGNNGLARYLDGKWQVITESDGLPSQLVYTLLETQDPDGQRCLWVGTRGRGLARLKAGRWSRFGPELGFEHPSIYALTSTPRTGGGHRVWVGTLGGGLGYWDTDRPSLRWRWLTTETHPRITSNSVISLSLDLQGRLYLGTLRGVNRITLPPGSEDDPNAWKVERFGPAEGLPSQICYDRASMRDAQGRVWIGTLRGAAILDPARTPVQEPPVPVVLDHVWVGGEEFFGESRLSLKYTQHQLTVAYSLPQFHEVEEQRFQSQLLPIEERPTPWQKAGRRELSGLAPGSYLLRIWGRDHLGRVTGPLAFPFEAQAPPWKRPWAYLVYAALGALLLQALTRWRLRRLEANNRTLQAHVQAAVAATEAQRQLLERSNEEKNRMMGILAHDLRNPLGAIRLYADELVEFPDDAEETRNNATRIGKAVDRMLEMIIRLLDFNAIDTGRITLKLQPIQVGEMLQVIEEEQEPKARAKGLKVALDLAPDAPPLVGDAMHLKEVLDNLVSNAIKFMVPGPPARQVTLRLRPGLIEVQDEGPGFAPEDISKVFGRFERLSARPTGGETSTGLGLSIVKSLVEAMGGSVQLRSEPGAGACFQIRLPLA